MAKSSEKNGESENTKLRESLSLTREASDGFQPLARYLKFINIARIVVAVVAAICGLAFAFAENRVDYLQVTLRREPGIWTWATLLFGTGFLACQLAALALVIEYLARPAAPKRFPIILFVLRFLMISVVASAIFYAMYKGYGSLQGIVAVASFFLVLATLREHRMARIRLGIMAVLAIGLTLWGTQTTYQYACHHAEEIVAAGNQLRDRCASTPEGQEIPIDDSRIPHVLRKLGAQRIWVDDERVAVYVGGETEFQIYRLTHPTTTCNPVWGFKGKGATKIIDRLWTNDY